MDELTNNTEVIEESTPAEEVVEGLTDAELDAMWNDDDDDGFVETDTAEEADQQTTEPVETEEAEPTETEQPKDDGADQYLELKHLGEVKKVTKDEATVLAQKGMDYDRIHGKLDEANTELAKLKGYESFLKELQGDFASIEDLMNDTRARVKADKEGISYEDALAKVKEANKPKEEPAPQPTITKESVFEQMAQESITAFLQKYPTVKADKIPKEVWDDMQLTHNLVASYERYTAMQKLAQENETLRKNAENKARSIGSMKSSGSKSQRDEIDEMWYDDDY